MGTPGATDQGGADVVVADGPDTLAATAADQAAAVLRRAVDLAGTANAMFATGNSQLAFVDELVDPSRRVPWDDVVVFHMDEYVGIGPDHPASFERWIRRADRRAHHARRGALPRRDSPSPTPSASGMPGSWRPTPSICAASASARTATWPSTTPRWPTSTTPRT